MPRTINEGFADFLTRLTPNKTDSEAAKSHRASIEACLERNYDLKFFFRTGSVGHGTSIAGYSDVDYFACIPRERLRESSSTTLSNIRDTLDNRFPNTGVRVSCPAIVVPFGVNGDETTEVVPADYMYKTSDGYNVYDIPNPDYSGSWIKASPSAQNAYVKRINDKHSLKVKPLIRFLKAWKYFNNVPISSFYLEMRTTKYADGESTIVYSYDIKRVFSLLDEIKLASLQDPLGISGYIHASSTQTKIDESYSKVQTALSRAEKAIEEEKEGNISNAFFWWNLLFDNQFPSYYR